MKQTSKLMTVMQVIPNLGAGGAEQTCVDVTEALVKSGYRAIVVSNGGPRVTDIKRAGGEHIQLPVHSRKSPDNVAQYYPFEGYYPRAPCRYCPCP